MDSHSALVRRKIYEEVKQLRGEYTNKTVPTDKLWEEIAEITKSVHSKRDAFNALYSWAIPSKEVIKRIAELVESKPGQMLISIGAGLGLWERMIFEEIQEKKDHPVIALEICESYLETSPDNTYYPLTRGDPTHDNLQKIDPCNNCVLLICWPHKNTMVDALRKHMPEFVVYVGETDSDGCNEGKEFMDELNGHHFGHMFTMDIPKWKGLNDVAKFYMCTI
jgi:hypothetical protein